MNLMQDYMDCIIDKDEFLYAKSIYEKKYDEMINEREMIIKQKAELIQVVKQVDEILHHALEFNKKEQLNRELIDLLIERINIFEDKRIEIVLSFQTLFNQVDIRTRKVG